jgi:Outer membrane protein beta-barrel domain
MEDLFKQFRDNLENRPEPKLEERDWQDMQARLKLNARTRPTAFAWWWMVVPFMLLMTGSNAFFFWQWKNAEQQVTSLRLRHDTVFHTRVVYTTDTVYRTRVIRERVVEYQNTYRPGRSNILAGAGELSVSENKKGLIDKQISKGEDLSTGQKVKIDLLHSKVQNVETSNNAAGIQSQHRGNNDLTTISTKGELAKGKQPIQQYIKPLPIAGINEVKYPKKVLNLAYHGIANPPKKYKKSFADHLYMARPKGYQVGLSSGLAHPYARGVDFKSGYSIGGHGVVEFSPSLRLCADAAYFETLFLTDRMGDDIGVPMVAPPSDEYLFLQAEVPQPFFQYSLGMQYLFRSKHRIKPFVGLGLGAISLLPYDVIYEFKNTTLGVEWNLDQTIHRQGLITNFLVLPVGLEYGISRHWNAQVQATYRYNWKETGVRSPDMFGIQGVLNYRF